MATVEGATLGMYLIVRALDFSGVYGPLNVPPQVDPQDYCITAAKQAGRAFGSIFDTKKFSAGTFQGPITLESISYECVKSYTRPIMIGPKWPGDK